MAYVRHALEKVTASEDAAGPTYKAEYLVTVDDEFDGPNIVIVGMPWRLNMPYAIGNDQDSRSVVKSVSVNPVSGNNFRWQYSVDFAVPERVGVNPDNPLLEPAQYEWTFAQGEKELVRDVHGKPIQNSAGDRFDDVFTREDSQPVLSVTRNEPASRLFFGFDLRDTINRNTWMGAPRRTVKFQPPRATSQYHKSVGLYYQKSYQFKFSDETWRLVILDQGLNELKTTGTGSSQTKTRVRMKDGSGNDITEPYALDGKGKKLGTGKQPVWTEFDGYRETNFPNF